VATEEGERGQVTRWAFGLEDDDVEHHERSD